MKRGLSLERMLEVENELQAMRNRLVELHCEVANAYPRQGRGGKAARSMEKAQGAIDQARWLLEVPS